MRFVLATIFLLTYVITTRGQGSNAWDVKSPDGTIVMKVSWEEAKGVSYRVLKDNVELLEESTFGAVVGGTDFSRGSKISAASMVTVVKDTYQMLRGKRSTCSYEGNERIFTITKGKETLDVIARVSNEAVAFRYGFSNKSASPAAVTKENTVFNLPDESKGFLQPMSVAKTGWSRVNPCYEEFYELGIPLSKPSSLKNGWVYPALFEVRGKWLLITEAGLDENYCGTHLSDGNTGGKFSVIFPQAEEFFPGGGLLPVVKGKSYSPWRIIVVGDLKTVIESTVGTDLAAASTLKNDASWIKPGHASWSWALLKDDSITYDVQRKYIDHASDMGWEYCLIDVNWDTKIGYDKMRALASYAKTRNVGLILWYNSAGNWNDAPYTPRSVLLTKESRQKEFARLKDMGIKGVKIDFFGGDGQSFMKYYLDILNDAAAYNLLVNFHGATIPRGWHRTHPHLMTAEAVKGFEYVTFEQKNADMEPTHCAVLPFARNAFDPMDFTPLSLHKIPNINRKTSSSFELALSVIFLSGIQHFVETPEGMREVPNYVREFLIDLPVKWDETKFVSGYPGRYVVLARRSGSEWFVSGINAMDTPADWTLDLSFVAANVKGYFISDDNANGGFRKVEVSTTTQAITVPSNGGFVMVLSAKEKS